ncbi:MAG: hypothetical protein NVS3B20_20370 [Polyangiales bacterium]
MPTSEASATDLQTRRNRRHFLLRRLHSLTGIVPVGLFLMEHLWTNSKAVQGRICFNNAVTDIVHLPFLPLIEIGGIFLPLAFHALYGVKLAFESKQNFNRYGYGRNWMFFLQRITGVITLVFIILHLRDFRIAKLLGTTSDAAFFPELMTQLSSRVKALWYVVGVTASTFHFANGVRTFVFGWGLTISQKSQRWAAYAAASLGLALWFLGTNTVLYFATGGTAFVPSSILRGENGKDLCEETLTPAPSEAVKKALSGQAGVITSH